MTVQLPALRGDDSLGFLAAVGIMALAEYGEITKARLSWSVAAVPIAILEGPQSREQLADDLRLALDRLRTRKAAIPGLPADIPLVGGSGPDPMRMPREELAERYNDAEAAWLSSPSNPWWGRWLIALAAQSAVKESEERKRVDLTPFSAPTGQFKLRNSLFDKSAEGVVKVNGPEDALTGWRRLPNYDGANLDARAKRDATVTTSGEAQNQGAPSPTWLAAMAIRFFPMTEDGDRTAAVGWQRVRLYPGYTQRSLIWPVWREPLDAAGVRTLLAHPAIDAEPPFPRSPDPPICWTLSALPRSLGRVGAPERKATGRSDERSGYGRLRSRQIVARTESDQRTPEGSAPDSGDSMPRSAHVRQPNSPRLHTACLSRAEV